MKSLEYKELEQLALAAELARPLVHECNNFLNNLLLQLAISENDFPEAVRADWKRIRQDGRELAHLLKEWQRQRKSSPGCAEKTELNSIMQELQEDLSTEESPVHLTVRLAPEPLWLSIFAGEIRRVCRLLVRYAISVFESGGNSRRALVIQSRKMGNKIMLQIHDPRAATSALNWAEFEMATGRTTLLFLIAATCKGLIERHGGSIHVEKPSDGCFVLVLNFPSAA
jgi:signal transduction histidine kinase